MKIKSSVFAVFITLTLFAFLNCSDDSPSSPTLTLEDEINTIANDNVKVGMVIGIINKQREKLIFTYGSKSLSVVETPDENTVFDIGSTTKTFTALLVIDTYLKGNFTNDTVQNYLPQNVKMPTYNGTPIQIIHLLTHSSGLPRTPHVDGQSYPLPFIMHPDNPYEQYTTEHVYDYLSNYCELKFEPGTYWEYSNTGFGLLGHIVGLVNNSTFEKVLHTKVFEVLEMNNSSLELTNQQSNNYSLGYNGSFVNVPYFLANDIFQGAGFIKSSLSDLFKYLEANVGLNETNLQNAMDLTHEPQFVQGSMGNQGLAWYILELPDGQSIVYSGGDTQGHSAFIGFNKSLSTGAIVLSNYAMHGDQLAMGQRILEIINKY